jgi:CO/xanthine dehydrogenase Mo-binding subunit
VKGLNLEKLPAALRPQTVVTQADLDRNNIATPWFDAPSTLMVTLGTVPYYLGQPVAMLIFDDPEAGAAAWRLMQFDPSYINYDAVTQPVDVGELGHTYSYIRYSKDGREVFSQVQQLAAIDPTATTTVADCEGKAYQDKIRQLIATAPAQGWTLFRSNTGTQAIDPMFMEPQSGMAYFQQAGGLQTLGLVLGTQSPNGDAQTIGETFGASTLNPSEVTIYSCYPGGGFGGRDTSLFPTFVSIAGAFSPNAVVRLEYDRFAQFQSGLKRNGSQIGQVFAVDAQGRLQAISSEITLIGGGKQNYSPFVAELAGICGAGAYAVPMNDITAKAIHSIGPTAGSMRGFGGPQAFFAVEHLMDRIAASMKIDPIELRLLNVLREGSHTVTGAPITEPIALREICELARANPLWVNRDAERRRREGGSTRYGVGFALANQAYGTGTDGVMACVQLEPDGKVTIITNAVDMGNGSATSLAISTARWLGANAGSIEMGNITFSNVLNLTDDASAAACAAPTATETARFSRGQHPLRARMKAAPPATTAECGPNPPPTGNWANPCYTASIFMSSSACITAFHQTHVVEQASRVVFLAGIVPTARLLWQNRSISADAMRWENGSLVAVGHPPLPLALLAAEMHRQQQITGATAHALYQGRWVAADYTVAGTTYTQLPIDALAVREGGGGYTRIVRQNVVAPLPQAQFYGRSLYAPSGTLAALEIEKSTGAMRLIDIVTYVDAGRPIQRQLLEGQYEGAVAMGFGYTFLESMPQGAGGAGEGTWNLNRYGLALATDLPPLGRMKLVTVREDSHSKGISEAVLCPIPPALANAAAHATGKFFDSLPITMQQLKEAL